MDIEKKYNVCTMSRVSRYVDTPEEALRILQEHGGWCSEGYADTKDHPNGTEYVRRVTRKVRKLELEFLVQRSYVAGLIRKYQGG